MYFCVVSSFLDTAAAACIVYTANNGCTAKNDVMTKCHPVYYLFKTGLIAYFQDVYFWLALLHWCCTYRSSNSNISSSFQRLTTFIHLFGAHTYTHFTILFYHLSSASVSILLCSCIGKCGWMDGWMASRNKASNRIMSMRVCKKNVCIICKPKYYGQRCNWEWGTLFKFRDW